MGTRQQTFRDLIAANKQKTFLLVVIFCLLVVVVAMGLSLAVILALDPSALDKLNWGRSLLVGLLAGAVAVIVSFFGYFVGDDLVLAAHGARPVQHQDDPELFNVVEEMAIAAGVPRPRVYLIRDSAPNAFATGRDPQHATVAITTGLRSKLTRDELQGVIAHEMAHIRNYDIRLMLLMALLVGSIVMLCDFFWQIVRFAPDRSDSNGRDKKAGAGSLVVIFLIMAVVLAILAPLLAQIIQLAVSRQREYLADASAVEFTRYPQGLANALRKIDADPAELKTANRGTAHLYVANPIKHFEAKAATVFASHPPIRERIRRLEALAQ